MASLPLLPNTSLSNYSETIALHRSVDGHKLGSESLQAHASSTPD